MAALQWLPARELRPITLSVVMSLAHHCALSHNSCVRCITLYRKFVMTFPFFFENLQFFSQMMIAFVTEFFQNFATV